MGCMAASPAAPPGSSRGSDVGPLLPWLRSITWAGCILEGSAMQPELPVCPSLGFQRLSPPGPCRLPRAALPLGFHKDPRPPERAPFASLSNDPSWRAP